MSLNTNTGTISTVLDNYSDMNTQKYVSRKFGGNMMTSSPLKSGPNGQKTSFYLFSIDILYPGSIFDYLMLIFYIFHFFDKNT